jgi:hypothetical protein
MPVTRALEQTFYPLGFPLLLSTNSEDVLEIARNEWNRWVPLFDEAPVKLHIEVSSAARPISRTVILHVHRHLFALVADSESAFVFDTRSRTGTGWVTHGAIEDASWFRYHFLDAIVYQAIALLCFTPIHGACVAREGRGVLLCGDSEAGKSSLAYACARRGWTYVTDDASWLIRRRAAERVVVGNAHQLRLRPDAAQIFPELADRRPVMRGNGKLSLEIWTDSLPSIATATSVAIDRLIFLRRVASGPAVLAVFDRAEARAWCERVFYWWDPEVAAEQQANLSGLLDAVEVQALEYSDVESAVDAIEG